MDEKPILKSKTFWVNLLAVVGSVAASLTGNPVPLDPEVQAGSLAFVNILLRIITKDKVTLS